MCTAKLTVSSQISTPYPETAKSASASRRPWPAKSGENQQKSAKISQTVQNTQKLKISGDLTL